MGKKVYDLYIKAKPISYSSRLRLKKNVLGIVIHNTGNDNDTARNNCFYFGSQGSNERNAGAHFFIDQNGTIGKSIPMNRSAWSVGNPKGAYAPGPYSHNLDNFNTVSIELCDIMSREPSEAMLESLDKVVAHIKKYCKNVQYIVRHYDIVRKDCPHRYVEDEKAWRKLQSRLNQIIQS